MQCSRVFKRYKRSANYTSSFFPLRQQGTSVGKEQEGEEENNFNNNDDDNNNNSSSSSSSSNNSNNNQNDSHINIAQSDNSGMDIDATTDNMSGEMKCNEIPDVQCNDDNDLMESSFQQNMMFSCCSDSNWLTDMFEKECNEQFKLPRDHDLPCDKNNPTGLDLRTMAIEIQDWKSRHNIADCAVDDMFEIMQSHFITGRFPTIKKNPLLVNKPTFGESKALRNNVNAYAGVDSRTWNIDICDNSCIAFHGVQVIKGQTFDCSTLIECPVCQSQRFSKCSHPDCKDLEYAECNPFEINSKTGALPPASHKRIPMKTMYYRSLASKFISLYKDSLKPGHENLLKYMDISVDGVPLNRVHRDDCIIDTSDGKFIKESNLMMKEQHEKLKAWWELQNPGEILHECSILYTVFYDGMTIFDRDCASVWPMLGCVLNCDPSKRTKMGVGMFLNSLHDVPDSGAEAYLIDKVFVHEVAQLEKGMIFNLEDDLTDERKTVFLQARCIYAHLDTIAYQSLSKMQGSGSLYGCKCQTVHGLSRHKFINRVALTGERGKLDQEHFLRQYSMNEEDLFDCNDFYNNGQKSLATLTSLFDVATLVDKFDRTKHKIVCGKSFITKKEIDRMSRYKAGDAPTPQWYNHEFPLSLYSRALCYPTRDTRVQLLYANCHISHELYLEYGTLADDARGIWEEKHWFKEKPQTKPSFAVNGVNGVLSLFRDTKSMKITNLTYDVMHIAKNISELFNQIFTGHRASDDAIRKLCSAQNMFLFLRYKNIIPPWRGKEADVIIMDSLCNCLLIPTGHKTSFGLRWPCRRNGQLRAKEHLTLLMAYNAFFYSFTSMDKAYVDYFARFASDLCRLLNPCIDSVELESLKKSIIETRSLHEGMFPETEHNFVHHEIVDLVNHIEEFGAARGLQCFGGERNLSTLSSLIAKGGVNPIKGVVSRYVALENINSKDLSTPFEYVANDGKYSDFVLKLCGEQEKMTLTLHELDALLKEVLNVIETYNLADPLEKSSFYRVAQVYKECKVIFKFAERGITFGMWLRSIYDRFVEVQKTGDPLTAIHFAGYLTDICFDESIGSVASAMNAIAGILHVSDFSGIIKDVATFVPSVRFKVIIKGVKYGCRGRNFREVQPAVVSQCGDYFIPTNKLNNLAANYHQDDDYSSWLRVKYYHVNSRNLDQTITTDEMVQLNLVYRLDWKNDSYVHGLAFGDACIRITKYDPARRKFYVNPTTCYNGERQYICLNNVCSTPIGLCVLDASNLPLIRQTRYNSVSWSKETHNIRIAPFGGEPARIYFLELQPERINYMYGLLEDDPDGTKLWEADSK